MKTSHLFAAVAATAFFAGAAAAQQPADQGNPPSAAPSSAQPSDQGASATTSATANSGAATGQAVTTSATTTTDASGASFTNMTTTNGPVPDTPDNRRKYGGPMSHAGKHTKPAGN